MLDSCFRNSSPTIAVELLYSVKIPDSVEEISDRCLLFNRGMECVQHYLNVCVDQQERKIIENEVYGAKRLYEFLCRDRSYQQESAQQSLGALPEPVCGQISQMLDSCFRNSSPTIAVELLYSVKIPDSVEEISDRCLLFNRGMECVQHYLNVCVDQQERKIIENEVYGAKRLYEFLCRDRSYQQARFFHRRFMFALPSARYGYENCVANSARHKCRPDSALFLRTVARLLSTDRHFLNCDKIEHEVCSSGTRAATWRVLLAAASLALLLLAAIRW
ncbi:AGAP001742-PA-like protein [Anopheles sinensis]|uniref:AGAP001742-PA-like protein n=1 Tax=Anopheles sinensis TaxID=74873 RepID=A0A084VZG1_ANOSI|nr:AGAP001742-PA-like protein [Anopheles sinensis]